MVRHAYKWYAFRRQYVRIRPSKRAAAAAMSQASDERSFCRRLARKSLRVFGWAIKPTNWLHLFCKFSYQLVGRVVKLIKLMIAIMLKPVKLLAKPLRLFF